MRQGLRLGLCLFLASLSAIEMRAQTVEVVDLPVTATAFHIGNAHQAYKSGHIIRMTGGSPEQMRALLGVDPVGIRSGSIHSRRLHGTTQPLSEKTVPSWPIVTAVRLAPNGTLHQFVAVSDHFLDRSWTANYEKWVNRQKGIIVGDMPTAPPDSWTKVLDLTASASSATDWGSNVAQLTTQVYRLNVEASDPNNLPTEKYMVTQYFQSQPNFYYQYCHALQCGWYTLKRTVSVLPSGGPTRLVDNQPADVIGTTNVQINLGAGLGPDGPSGSAGVTLNWSQPDVTTQNQSNLTTLQAAWTENMGTENSAFISPAQTYTDLFGSYDGAVYEVPAGVTSFGITAKAQANFYAYTILYDNYNSVFVENAVAIAAPVFAVNTDKVTIPPGGSGLLELTSSIPGSKSGLPWKIEDLPDWLDVDQRTGAGSTTLTLRVQPNTPLQSSTTLNLSTDPPYAAPSVSVGPLKVAITVDTPPASGLLLTGGYVNDLNLKPTSLNQGQVYSQGTFNLTTPMTFTRTGHTATKLLNGNVLIAGGVGQLAGSNATDAVLGTAEIYSPATGSYQVLQNARQCPGIPGCLTVPRTNHTATLLKSGKVLLVGGNSALTGDALATAEIYDPATQLFTAAGNLNVPRTSHSATALPSGDVLIAGGSSTTNGANVNSGEVYRAATGTFVPAANSMSTARSFHATTLLTDDRVLISGGMLITSSGANSVSSADFFSPPSATFTKVNGTMSVPRDSHQATLLANGQVLISGGEILASPPGGLPIATPQATAEIFDPNSQTFTVLSGTANCPGAPGCMLSPRYGHVAVRLPSNQVLLASGAGPNFQAASTSEIYDPGAKQFLAGSVMEPAIGSTWTVLERVPSQISLTVNPNPAPKGQPVTFTATVKSLSANPPTGNVSFMSGGVLLGTAALNSNGVASFTSSSLALQNYSVTAVYAGDSYVLGSTSSAIVLVVNLDPSVTTITSSKSPADAGEAVTFTASVAAGAGTSGIPTGSVTFSAGEVLQTVDLTNGTASTVTSALRPGSYTVSARYSGDANFAASTSAALNQQINVIPSQITLTAAPTPSAPGQAVTLTASVLARPGDLVAGTVSFLDGSTSLGSATLNQGEATLTVSTLTAGAHTLTARYAGTSTYAPSTSAAVPHEVLTPVTVSLTTNSSPSAPGQSVTFTATVNAPSGSPAPTGTVTFKDGAAVLGSGTLANGVAFYSASGLTGGTHPITAAYSGDSNYLPVNSAVVNQVVLKSTATMLTSNANPAGAGKAVIFTASVQAAAGSDVPGGSIAFKDGTVTLATVPLANGVATYSISTLTPGTHEMTATYSGDLTWAASTSATVAQVIAGAPTVTVTSSQNPADAGATITLIAAVSGTAGVPTGTVTFLDGTAALGTASLSNGSATLNTAALAPGSHSITVRYGGDATYSAGTSAPLVQTVNGLPTVTVLASSPNPANPGQLVTLTATVSTASAASVSGAVVFLDGTTTLATVPLTNGSAQFITTTLAAGSHAITARYQGNSQFAASTSPVLNQVISNATSTAITMSAPASIAGDPVTFTAAVQAPSGTPTGTVTFRDGAVTLGAVPLANGTAALTTRTLTVGSHTVSAVYSGDAAFAGSTSPGIVHTVTIVVPPTGAQ